MKHIFAISLICSLSSIIASENPWHAYKTFQHDDNLRSAYFNAQETSIIMCAGEFEKVIDIQSGRSDDHEKINKNAILCLNPTEKFFILNWSISNQSTNVIYWPYKGRTNESREFNSTLTVTPHRCTLQKYGEKRELAGITDGSDMAGYWLRLYDVSEGKVFLDYYHPCKVKDFCFNENKNIVASITSSPDPAVRIWNTEKWYRFPEKDYAQELYSIRFDETGNRLVVTGRDTIEILDVTNPQELKTITSLGNPQQSRQACLSGKWLAIALQSSIKLFDIQTKKEIASLRGNNNSSPMDCFSPAGNFLVVLDGKQVVIYKKTEPKKAVSLASHKETAIITGSHESSDECCQLSYQKQIITTLASIYTFLESKFCGC